MKVTQEKLPQSQVQLQIEVPAAKSQQVYEQVVRSLTQNVKLPGFRQGKVPQKVLIQRLGESRIKANTLEQLLQDSLREALTQEKIYPISEYELATEMDDILKTFVPGQPLTFTVKFDVPPVVNLGEYKGLKIVVEELKVTEEEVNEFLEEKRRENAPLVPVEGRAAQLGDVVIIDYLGKLEGEDTALPGGEAQDFQLELEKGRFIEEFIDGIVGMEAETTKQLPVNFPEDYPREDLAGKPAEFTITLKEIKEKELPELDDDFAQDFSEFETIEELRAKIQKNFEERSVQEMQTAKEKAIAKELVKIVEVDLPESMIVNESNFMLRQAISQLEKMGMDVNGIMNDTFIREMRDRSRPEAITSLQQTLALLEVAKRESLIPSEAEVKEAVSDYISQIQGKNNVDKERLQEFFQEDMTKANALKWLVEQAEVELVPEGTLVDEEEVDEEELEEQAIEELIELAEIEEAIEVTAAEISDDISDETPDSQTPDPKAP
jgi:trigger factor